MGYGEWTNDSRGTYNKWDGIARSTTQVLLKCLVLLLCYFNINKSSNFVLKSFKNHCFGCGFLHYLINLPTLFMNFSTRIIVFGCGTLNYFNKSSNFLFINVFKNHCFKIWLFELLQ